MAAVQKGKTRHRSGMLRQRDEVDMLTDAAQTLRLLRQIVLFGWVASLFLGHGVLSILGEKMDDKQAFVTASHAQIFSGLRRAAGMTVTARLDRS